MSDIMLNKTQGPDGVAVCKFTEKTANLIEKVDNLEKCIISLEQKINPILTPKDTKEDAEVVGGDPVSPDTYSDFDSFIVIVRCKLDTLSHYVDGINQRSAV